MKIPLLIKKREIYPSVKTTTVRNGIKDKLSRLQEHRPNLLYNNKLQIYKGIVSDFDFKNIKLNTLNTNPEKPQIVKTLISSDLVYKPVLQKPLESVPIAGIDRLTPK